MVVFGFDVRLDFLASRRKKINNDHDDDKDQHHSKRPTFIFNSNVLHTAIGQRFGLEMFTISNGITFVRWNHSITSEKTPVICGTPSR